MVILGVDPGINHHAAAVLQLNRTELRLLDVASYTYTKTMSLEEKLHSIYHDFEYIIQSACIDIVSIEAQYFGGNARTLRSLCEGVGATKIAVMSNSRALIRDFTPNELKIAATGIGNASKKQVQDAINMKFNIMVSNSDEADSIAAGLACILFSKDIITKILAANQTYTGFANDLFKSRKLTAQDKINIYKAADDILTYKNCIDS